MTQMLHENDKIMYVIKVKGQTVSIPYSSPSLAEQNISLLAPEHQLIAEVVPVTQDGREILLG